MYDLIRRWALAILKAPPEPHPPFGDPASLRVFNAGRNYFRLRMTGWTIAQVLALGGFIFWTAFLFTIEGVARAQKEARANRVASESATTASETAGAPGETVRAPSKAKRRQNNWTRAKERVEKAASEPGPEGKASKKGKEFHAWAGFKQMCVELAQVVPAGAFLLIWAVKIFSFLVYLAQIPLTYATRRLDYEMRWYMVTDRSLRLRYGVWKISESTMSFANIQQVAVSQGPLQRLLGLADVKVKSAGGGGEGGHYNHKGPDMHTGFFHNVTNASEIRDLIQERLRRFRDLGTGLGDPDEKPAADASSAIYSSHNLSSLDALSAARELAAEARALRGALVA